MILITLYNYFRKYYYAFLSQAKTIILLLRVYAVAIYVGRYKKIGDKQPSLVWGCTPLANNIYWSQAMKMAGFESETFMTGFYEIIHKRSDWDHIISEKYLNVPAPYKPYYAMIESLMKYDVFFISFDGYFLGNTPYWRRESIIFRLARKKVVVIPYGGDAYVYRRIRSSSLLHGLLSSYPMAARIQEQKAQRLDHWNEHADFVISGIMGMDGFGRWDVLSPSSLSIDTERWRKSKRRSHADGRTNTVYLAHAPNHRGFKGTEFVIEIIDELKKDGYMVELILIEKMLNEDLKKKFEFEVDILVEQIIFTGYALNGIEGMASGLCVISNMEDETYMTPQRRWSFLSECPVVSGSPETLKEVLILLITQPALRHELGDAGRMYAEKYHSLTTSQYFFGEILKFIYGKRPPLTNLFHPLLGEYTSAIPKIKHPLENNKIVT
jgi:hypothetical protein